MSKPAQRALLLAFAGVVSALLCGATPQLAARLNWFYPGLIFGIAIAAVFVFHAGVRSPLKPIGFIAASCVAYPISLLAGFGLFALFNHGSSSSGPLDIPLPAVFGAGSLGAFVVFFSAFLLFGSANLLLPSMARPTLLSLIGGVLAVIGWIAADAGALRSAQNYRDPSQSMTLYVIWQAGVALCLDLVVPVEAGRTSASIGPARRSMATKIAAGLFFGVILTILAGLVYRDVQGALPAQNGIEGATR
jgi:hypothetical protein